MNPEVIDEIAGKLPSARSASRVEVVFRDADSVEISVQQWIDLSLKEGMPVTRELYSALQEAEAETEALETAFRLLQTRPRTEHEVDLHLEKKEYSPRIRRQVKQRLSELKLLDDHQFARMYIEQKRSQMSQMELSWKLRQRGVQPDVADSVLHECYDHRVETDTAMRLATKQWYKHRAKSLPDRKMKVGQYLQRKGFQISVIYSVLDDLERFHADDGTRS